MPSTLGSIPSHINRLTLLALHILKVDLKRCYLLCSLGLRQCVGDVGMRVRWTGGLRIQKRLRRRDATWEICVSLTGGMFQERIGTV